MSKYVVLNKGRGYRRFLYYVFSMGILISLISSSAAFAVKPSPPDPWEESVPVQLSIIRSTLADMESNLSTQMTEMEGRLTTKIDDMESSLSTQTTEMEGRLTTKIDEIETSVIDVNDKLDTLQDTADDIFNVVSSVDIEFTEKFCIDGDFGVDVHGGVDVEGGGEWPLVLKLKAVLHGRGALAGSLGVANEICVEVPLYSVESPFPQFTHTGDIQAFIDSLSPSEPDVVPLLGGIFRNLMPTSDQTFESFGNVLVAGGYDMYGNSVGDLDSEKFTRLDKLLDPITPNVFDDYIFEFPNMLGEELIAPCTIADKSILGDWIEPDDYKWACVPGLGKVAAGAFAVIHTIEKVVHEICKVDPLCHL